MPRNRKKLKVERIIAVTAADAERARKHIEEMRQVASKTSRGSKRLRRHGNFKLIEPRGTKCPRCRRRFEERDLAVHVERCSKKALKEFRKRLARCPICRTSFLKDKLARHMTASHGQTFGTPANVPIHFKPLPPLPAPIQNQADRLIPCEKCSQMIYPHALQRHMRTFHSPEAELRAILNSAHRLSFVLLPSGRIRDAVEQFRSLSRTHRQSLNDAVFDWGRLEKVESFGKAAHYVGLKLWKGYVVFQFEDSDSVVLECPLTGNATYVLRGDWKKMVLATKAELRFDYRELTVRIFHNARWENRVRRAMFGSFDS